MRELVSVMGICFVAGTPENANLSDRSDIAENPLSERMPANGRRKYRLRGERTRKEQQQEASRRYYWEHLDKVREYQRKYRERKRQENEALQRTP